MATGSGIELLATGSDDGTVKIWEGGDEAGKQPVATFNVGCPVTSVCWGLDGNSVYIGAIDNEIHVCFSSPSVNIPFMGFWIIYHRFTTYARKSKCLRLQATWIPQPRLLCHQTETICYPPRSRRKRLCGTYDPSHLFLHGYIVYSTVHQLVSNKLYWEAHGVKMTAADGLL